MRIRKLSAHVLIVVLHMALEDSDHPSNTWLEPPPLAAAGGADGTLRGFGVELAW